MGLATERIEIRLSPELVRAMDAARHGQPRSTFVRAAIESAILRREEMMAPPKRRRKTAG